MSESERHIESVQFALRLLTCFESDEALRLEDLHERTGLTRSRIIRMTGTLLHEGFLNYEQQSGRYLLGPSLYRLGSLVERRYGSFKDTVRHNLERLVAQTGYTALFSVISGQDRLILAKEEPDLDLRFTVREGRTRVVTAGATGRVILAFASSEFRKKAIANSALPEADKTRLEIKLKSVSEKGFEFSKSELTKHAFALAVPVQTASGQLIGALTLAGPAAAYDQAREEDLVKTLCEEAASLQKMAPFGTPDISKTGSTLRPRGKNDARSKLARA